MCHQLLVAGAVHTALEYNAHSRRLECHDQVYLYMVAPCDRSLGIIQLFTASCVCGAASCVTSLCVVLCCQDLIARRLQQDSLMLIGCDSVVVYRCG